MNAAILNREFKHPVDGWYHIEPKGEHPNRPSGVIQVIDAQSILSIVNRFNEAAATGQLSHGHEMLIDHEHFKHDMEKETRAYGWLQKLENRADGIYGQIRWTGTGKEAVDGGDYRFFSTEYLPADTTILNDGKPKRVRPLRLDGLTLTNKPNNKGGRPITNRDEKFPQGNQADADKPKEQNKMKSVCTKLGLSADASEESVLAAIGTLLNRATTAEDALDPMKNRAEKAEGKVKNLEDSLVEGTLNQYQNRFAKDKRDGWKKALIANRENTIELLEGMPVIGGAPAGQRPMHNRKETQTPVDSQSSSDDNAVADRIKNRADELKAKNPARKYNNCWKQAEGEIAAEK